MKICSFGGCETEDATAAIEFLRGLKTPNQISLVNKDIGLYGVELGSLSALNAAAKDQRSKPWHLIRFPETRISYWKRRSMPRFPFASYITAKFARLGTYLYFFDGCYKHESFCDTARLIEDRKILLIAGVDSAAFQDSTGKLAKCFAVSNKIEQKLDLSPSGFNIINASTEQSESYDQRVIDFFRASLQN